MHYYETKDANNKVTYDVINTFNVFNIFECAGNNPDVSYDRAYMANER